MNLEEQLKILIDDAPEYGVPAIVVRKAIAPVLELFARQLSSNEYYVLQNLDSDWLLTTIVNPQLQEEKQVIYAFKTVGEAAAARDRSNPDLIAVPIPITHLLFRLFSLQQVDSLIVLDDSPNSDRGVEIRRDRLSALIQQQIQQLTQPPSNIA
jgi:hypothetical protein